MIVRYLPTMLVLAGLCSAQDADHHRLLMDWGGLTRYGSENADLGAPKPGEQRVVFIGDDITERWGEDFFPGKSYLNRGIRGQTSPQMLVRFQQDVIALKPKVVVIQAGSNDLAGLTGPATEGSIASLTPVCDCYRKLTLARPQGKIIGLNGWIRDYAARTGSVYLNYYSALASGRDFKKELTVDGLIPNEAGYRIMSPLAEQAIADALAKSK
jgi:lysophospholipase L1-like esterase